MPRKEKVCPKCGQKGKSTDVFCEICGTKLVVEKEEEYDDDPDLDPADREALALLRQHKDMRVIQQLGVETYFDLVKESHPYDYLEAIRDVCSDTDWG